MALILIDKLVVLENMKTKYFKGHFIMLNEKFYQVYTFKVLIKLNWLRWSINRPKLA